MTCPVCGSPSLCDDCLGTVHDPDVVTGRANRERILAYDHAFAEKHALRPGDFVDSDGTITRDEDDYVARLKASIDAPIAKLVR